MYVQSPLTRDRLILRDARDAWIQARSLRHRHGILLPLHMTFSVQRTSFGRVYIHLDADGTIFRYLDSWHILRHVGSAQPLSYRNGWICGRCLLNI